MELTKTHWQKSDITEFENYLKSLAKLDKVDWTKKINQTQYTLYAIPTPTLRDIAKQISSGNYKEFLDLHIFSSFEAIIIFGIILTKIKDFNTLKNHLDIYSLKVDSWASCDVLSFNVKSHAKEFLALSEEYIKSDLLFKRRIGIIILLKFVNNEYIDHIFGQIKSLFHEQEYYVNMAIAWLLCECFIKLRNRTYEFFLNNKLNSFVINKTIQKCRDSFRVSKEDKETLLKFKQTT